MSQNLPIDTSVFQALQKEADSLGIPVHELADKILRKHTEASMIPRELFEKAKAASFREHEAAYRELAK